jgi:hypothetical protein
MGLAPSLTVFKALSLLFLLALPALGAAGPYPSLGLAPAIPHTATPPANLSVQFTGAGLTSVEWNGTEMLASGAPSVGYVGLVQPDGSWTAGDQNAVTTADVPNRILNQKFAWGDIRYAYTATPTQLFANVTIQNTSSTPVGMFIIQLAEVQFPATPSEYDGSDPMVAWNMGNPSIIHTTFGSGSLAVTNEDVVNPLNIGWPWALDAAETTFPLLVLTGANGSYPSSYPFINRPIPAGGTLEFKIGFRFGPANATNYELAGDIYQRFAAAFPQTLKWTDHRPVAQLMLASQNGTYATNPRCWFGDPKVDTTTPAGIAAFEQRVLAYADQAVAICKAENAQAAITWDIEGEQFPQNTTYIGDPRLISTLDPEMSPIVDAYFKKFTDAGLKIGMTIRPQQLVLSDSNQQATQVEVADPGKLMIAKMKYARDRWGARVFYVDSNGSPDNPMDPKFFQEVTKALPDILVSPEQSNMGYYPITAPYGQLNLGITGTPPEVRWTYPQAFRVFTVSDADITDNLSTLVNSVMRGDVLFFRGWFDAEENPQVQQIYQQAGAGTN